MKTRYPPRLNRSKPHARRKAVAGTADWARLYAKPEDMRTLPFGIDPPDSEQPPNRAATTTQPPTTSSTGENR